MLRPVRCVRLRLGLLPIDSTDVERFVAREVRRAFAGGRLREDAIEVPARLHSLRWPWVSLQDCLCNDHCDRCSVLYNLHVSAADCDSKLVTHLDLQPQKQSALANKAPVPMPVPPVKELEKQGLGVSEAFCRQRHPRGGARESERMLLLALKIAKGALLCVTSKGFQ